jgi:hypothetical protein
VFFPGKNIFIKQMDHIVNPENCASPIIHISVDLRNESFLLGLDEIAESIVG